MSSRNIIKIAGITLLLASAGVFGEVVVEGNNSITG
jgi:hypothetical protein